MKKMLLTAVALFIAAACFAQETTVTIREVVNHNKGDLKLEPFYLQVNGGPYLASPVKAQPGDWITVSANPSSFSNSEGTVIVTEVDKSQEEMIPGLGEHLIFPGGEAGYYIKCEFQIPSGVTSVDLVIDVYGGEVF